MNTNLKIKLKRKNTFNLCLRDLKELKIEKEFTIQK